MRVETIQPAAVADVQAIVLTFNEEPHIERCIRSVLPLCRSVLVVDSGSTDRTAAIAEGLGARVVVNPFRTHAEQINFGIDQLAGQGGWLFRIDADEYLVDDGAERLRAAVAKANLEVVGLTVRRRIHFMGRWIRHGGIYPIRTLRLWRNGAGTCEQRWMDEHVVVSGRTADVDADIADENLRPIGWWTEKHNQYAAREAVEILGRKYGFALSDGGARPAGAAGRKRWMKEQVYNRLPGALRAVLYFILRYVILLGFLDGRPGYFFHVLQGFWYRTLVDAKVTEIETFIADDPACVRKAIKRCTKIEI